jgi:flagellar L-ring protein precursor FlgH
MSSSKSLFLAAAFAALPLFAAEPPRDGSLLDAATYRGLAADRRAYRVGDSLTVLVLETAQAESSAKTGRSTSFDFDASLTTPSETRAGGASTSGSNDGSGRTTRQGRLTAQLTVRVTKVEPSGLLRVAGEQAISINGETQKIVVSGTVRPEDVSSTNAIVSSRLGDARIEYTGKGVVSETQRTNVIYRVLHWLGLS